MCRYLNGTKADDLFAAAEDLEQKVWVDMGACGWQEVGFFHLHRDGVDWVFVDHPSYQRPGAASDDSRLSAASQSHYKPCRNCIHGFVAPALESYLRNTTRFRSRWINMVALVGRVPFASI